MIKLSEPSFAPVLCIGIIVGAFLNPESAYSARTGLRLLVPIILFELAVMLLFAAAWQPIQNYFWKAVLAVFLLLSASDEILYLYSMYRLSYKGATGLLIVAGVVLAPVLYLRRKSAIIQTANASILIFGVAFVLLVISLSPYFRIFNLQYMVPEDMGRNSILQQFTIPPELLIAGALNKNTSGQQSNLKKQILGLTALSAASRLILCFVLELFFGAEASTQGGLFHMAAASGTMSIFSRMEWLQLLTWTLAVSVKASFFIYIICKLLHTGGNQNDEVQVCGCYSVAGAMLLLSFILNRYDSRMLYSMQRYLCWIFIIFVILGGALTCTLKGIKRIS